MSENKTGKYLKYALGEILLVMIGILLALQVNNWNQDRKSDMEEVKVLANLKHEFQISILELKEKNNQRRKILQSNYALIDMIRDKNFTNTGRIDSLLSTYTLTPTYNGKTGALDLIINSGKFNLLKNDSLKKQLLAWPLEVEDMTEEEEIYKNILWNEFIPFLRKYIKFNRLSRLTGSSISSLVAIQEGNMIDNYEGLFMNSEFENMLYEIEFFMLIGTLGSEKLIERAEHILSLVDKELEFRKG